jgi:hypothetical protein
MNRERARARNPNEGGWKMARFVTCKRTRQSRESIYVIATLTQWAMSPLSIEPVSQESPR